MAKRTILTFCMVKFMNRFPFNVRILCDHHLTNTFAIITHKIFLTEIDKYDPYITTIVSVDSTGSINNTQTVF